MFWYVSVHPSTHQSVCPQGGVPISHNALQHFPECHGAAGGGVPCQVQPEGGYPGWGVPWPEGGYPGWRGVPWPGGVPWLGGVPWPGGYPGQGGTQLGQHREYLLHGGRYASCIHAGGLSCYLYEYQINWFQLTVVKVFRNELITMWMWHQTKSQLTAFTQFKQEGPVLVTGGECGSFLPGPSTRSFREVGSFWGVMPGPSTRSLSFQGVG